MNNSKTDKTIFITGTTRGIGKALEELAEKNNFVTYSIGRQNNDFPIDLSEINDVEKFEFPQITTHDVILINNAGIIGEIGYSFEKEKSDVQQVINVNTIAPIILCEKFVRTYSSKKLTIINISSGAGRRAIASWANYCASKAALDLFSETLQLELVEKQISGRVFSLAPGVVNTSMQRQIRTASPEKFSAVANYKNIENLLLEPKDVASKIIHLINNEIQLKKVILRIEEITV